MQVEKNVDIVTIAGTRPEIIKLSELVHLLNGKHNHALLYSGQHYSDSMKNIFFDELGIKPHHDLRCDTSDVSKLKEKMVEFLRKTKSPYVLVYGDTNSSLAGALAAKEVGCTLIHIEAGLRCFDLTVPEELARIQIDSASNYLFPPSTCKDIPFIRTSRTECLCHRQPCGRRLPAAGGSGRWAR